MIITKTPFRMSFFGGGTDLEEFFKKYGGAVLSTTFDKYCYVTVRHLPPFFKYSSEFVYANIERVCDVEEIEHPLIKNLMKFKDMHEIRLSYEADLPARTGLGTSSSFAVGMLNAFYGIKGKRVDKRRLADEAIYVERVLCNEAGGIQDQIAAAYGGLNRIDMSDKGYKVSPVIMSNHRKKLLNDNLMLFFTGFSRFSANVQNDTKKNINDKVKQLLEMKSLVDEAEDILTNEKRNINDFGLLLDYTWKLKRGISDSISTNFIDMIYEETIKAGALGGKLLGAGGGGFLLFYVEKEKQDRVMNALKDYLYVPFEFETEGAQVIYFKAEDYEVPVRFLSN
ncbi:kinase [Selenomonas ruminantium]|uniref:GHMP family kinase ATP-binding protein n=1 Tax=Selenomonas ruminantium TaxID=971 RepID=UPI0026EF30EA|nr:kinase [Selenomonas ruminantium]